MKEAWRAVNTASEAGDIAGANEIEMQLWIDGPTRAPGVVDARVRERVSEMNSNELAAYNENATERDIEPPDHHTTWRDQHSSAGDRRRSMISR